MAYYSGPSTNPIKKNQLSIGRPRQIERRRATRHHFVSAVEVINVESRKQLISLTRNLSLCGCFVTVKAPSPKGTRVSLKISNSKSNFSAVGDVTHNLFDEGMGIEFVQVEGKDQAVLEEWLAEASANAVGHEF
ncbi:MAG: hypothetical protein AUH11_03970 [Acidobacteria bacterium 13_2_20CM_57_17]|nr:MAG: hypothetical protein AUH11_03970 [Acidobacteria bacterium 13_2_20CM_57_17]PYT38895.1 MAG: hypothetical protein DMG47_22470 [Acidobacteriota bacterium]